MDTHCLTADELPDLTIEKLGYSSIVSPLVRTRYHFTNDHEKILLYSHSKDLKACQSSDKELPRFERAGPRQRIFFDGKKINCGIVTCGGLCPGLNDVIRTIVLSLTWQYSVKKVFGFRYGYAGLSSRAPKEPLVLTPESVDEIHLKGGDILSLSRGRQDSNDIVSNLRKKEITEYQESVAEISRLDEFIIQMYAELDTIKIDSIRNIVQSEIPPAKKSLTENIYNLGELEAFHFKRSDSSMVHFQRIIDEFTDSEIYPKALFVMYYLNNQKGDETKAQIYSERILAELPVSEYADFLRKSMDLPDDPNSIQALLRQAELEWLINPENALIYYKNILQKDSISETSARAALFLAYHYDYTYFNQDSALKYYTWLQDYHVKIGRAHV